MVNFTESYVFKLLTEIIFIGNDYNFKISENNRYFNILGLLLLLKAL